MVAFGLSLLWNNESQKAKSFDLFSKARLDNADATDIYNPNEA
jgi:hypothetical protein